MKKTPSLLTQRDLCKRWGCSISTVIRAVREFEPEPETFVGLEPAFTEAEVKKLEHRRMAKRRQTIAKLRGANRGKVDNGK